MKKVLVDTASFITYIVQQNSRLLATRALMKIRLSGEFQARRNILLSHNGESQRYSLYSYAGLSPISELGLTGFLSKTGRKPI